MCIRDRRKSIEITTAEANIAKQEKEILLKQKEAEVMEPVSYTHLPRRP